MSNKTNRSATGQTWQSIHTLGVGLWEAQAGTAPSTANHSPMEGRGNPLQGGRRMHNQKIKGVRGLLVGQVRGTSLFGVEGRCCLYKQWVPHVGWNRAPRVQNIMWDGTPSR